MDFWWDSDSEPAKKPPRSWERTWPAADEIKLLEAFIGHRERHGKAPTRSELAAALRWRIRSEGRRIPKQISSRLSCLRVRYKQAKRRSSRGIIPGTVEDLTIYQLSEQIWKDTTPSVEKADARQDPRNFSDLEALYPCLAKEIENIEARLGAAAGVKMAFERIGDDRATQLEHKLKRVRMAALKERAKQDSLRSQVATTILEWFYRFLSISAPHARQRLPAPLTSGASGTLS
ncbi:hypothetical protein QOZ80_4AG0328150 [Eleusine coracana subsp. coracana]|nr:hypothetical protein QOZ80_4AG0328150 [Eleusine coracana subsp. coracana]